jgi:hypothetical protein
MKSLKYTLIIGVLCAGMTSLAHATLQGPFSQTLHDNGQDTELTAFRNLSGMQDATMCVVQSPGNETVTNSSGTFTFVNLPFNPVTGHFEVQVTFTTNPGTLVCGFLTKNGAGNLVFIYTLDPGQSSGTFTLEVPSTGALSHIDVFCCAGGPGVPDGGTTVMLLGAALSTLGAARRFFFKS